MIHWIIPAMAIIIFLHAAQSSVRTHMLIIRRTKYELFRASFYEHFKDKGYDPAFIINCLARVYQKEASEGYRTTEDLRGRL